MTRNLLFTLLALLVVGARCDAQKVSVGVVAPLTGALANVGESVRNMITLAAEDQHQNTPVTFIFEDDSFVPARTISAVRKLISHDKVSGLILFGSGTSAAAAPVAEAAGVPTIAIAMAESVVKGRPHLFRLYNSIEKQNEAIISEVRRRGYRRVAVISTQQEATLTFRDRFMQSAGVEIVANEEIAPGSTEVQTVATKMLRHQPEAVYLALLPPELSLVPSALRRLGYAGEFFGPAQLQNEAAVAAAGGSLDGAWFSCADDSAGETMYARYRTHFSDSPVPDGLHAFDAATLMIRGLNKGALQAFLRNPVGFTGVLGEYHLVEPNTYDLPVTIKRVAAGSFVRR